MESVIQEVRWPDEVEYLGRTGMSWVRFLAMEQDCLGDTTVHPRDVATTSFCELDDEVAACEEVEEARRGGARLSAVDGSLHLLPTNRKRGWPATADSLGPPPSRLFLLSI